MNTKITNERKQQAARLRSIREGNSFTQEQFAEIIGISVSSYKKFESGENQISLATLARMHDKLDVSSDYVLYDRKNDVSQVWADLLNCSESDKLFVFLKLFAYFSETKPEVFMPKDAKSDNELFEFIKNIIKK